MVTITAALFTIFVPGMRMGGWDGDEDGDGVEDYHHGFDCDCDTDCGGDQHCGDVYDADANHVSGCGVSRLWVGTVMMMIMMAVTMTIMEIKIARAMEMVMIMTVMITPMVISGVMVVILVAAFVAIVMLVIRVPCVTMVMLIIVIEFVTFVILVVMVFAMTIMIVIACSDQPVISSQRKVTRMVFGRPDSQHDTHRCRLHNIAQSHVIYLSAPVDRSSTERLKSSVGYGFKRKPMRHCW